MSNLYKNAMQARIAKLPHPDTLAPFQNSEDEESEAADSIGALPGSGLGPPAMQVHLHGHPPSISPANNPRQHRKPHAPKPEFAPISAAGFFKEAAQVSVPSRALDVRVYHTPAPAVDGTVMVCHHGAGYSGLSFACFAKEVAALSKSECGVLALDARRHGKTTSTDGNDEDLSIGVLVDDFFELLKTIFPDPSHSPTLLEGSALEALPHMHSLLNARPDGFDSIEEAVEWHVSTNTIQNVNSARVSIPAVFKQVDKGPFPYTWRTPLRSTAPYWTNKELMIGQMQGKFQQMVVPGVGHMLHEDDPTRIAEIMVEFWRRNERVIVGVKKVGEL
ncbi:hypothetical protein DFP72DRAFT_1044563 [Ephemerocybe angulata]|uniref:Protein phosphatase methylesterase 1 n=1 Tax=Ephemerocybe angulata TaxID=980116 RepID=A0A8H6M6N7_9AGAR|nr:hypothetical protein DFP72DRAFT_1044563 [Tulosesus angulatus]